MRSANCVSLSEDRLRYCQKSDKFTKWVQATEHLVQTMGFSVSTIQFRKTVMCRCWKLECKHYILSVPSSVTYKRWFILTLKIYIVTA